MSLISELASLLQKHPQIDIKAEIAFEEKEAAERCRVFLNQVIKKRKLTKEEAKKKRKQQKKMQKRQEYKMKHEEKNPSQKNRLTTLQRIELLQKLALKRANDLLKQDETENRKCYCCDKNLKETHSFYNSICIECGNLNFEMRNKTKDLTGYTAIVTGGRVKLGYVVALWLLRNNCHVIVTTRFPADALLRYKKEADYESFKERLFLYGLDFRDLKKVYKFIDYVEENFKQINILINNAAQTLYLTESQNSQLLKNEEMALKTIQEDLNSKADNSLALVKPNVDIVDDHSKVLETDFLVCDIDHVPLGSTSNNSWEKEIDEVDLREFAEAQVINSWIPFILCSRLKHKMEVQGKKSYIINVASDDGRFYSANKDTSHPHINMSKAALSMLTKTCGKNFAQKNILMISVDPGWCSDNVSNSINSEKEPNSLDQIDGAMRILQPIIQGSVLHSILLKNYQVSAW